MVVVNLQSSQKMLQLRIKTSYSCSTKFATKMSACFCNLLFMFECSEDENLVHTPITKQVIETRACITTELLEKITLKYFTAQITSLSGISGHSLREATLGTCAFVMYM
jgi:hypothetical protein